MLYFTCPEEVSSQRFLSRGQPGDTHENYRQRLEHFNAQTSPLIERKKEILKEVKKILNILFCQIIIVHSFY